MTFSRYRLVANTRTEMVNMKARISLPRKRGVGVADEQSQRRVGLRLFLGLRVTLGESRKAC